MRRRILASVGKSLPYLRRVAWLGNDGNQRIDIGMKITSPTDFVSTFECVDTTKRMYLIGQVPTTNGRFQFDYCNTKFFGYGSGYDNDQQSLWPVSLGWHTVRILDGQVWVDDKMYSRKMTWNSGNASSMINNCTLMSAWSQWGEIFEPFTGNVGSATFVQAGTPIRDFIPVLDLSARPAMYDEVSGQLFYNQGIGEFTWGELET